MIVWRRMMLGAEWWQESAVITVISFSGDQAPPFLLMACDLLLTINLPLAAEGPWALSRRSFGGSWG